MPEVTREHVIFTFDGSAVAQHEIEVSLLADSLVAFRSLAERASRIKYGRNADLLVKVKGGFRAGSFNIELILDWVVANPEGAAALATVGGAAVTGVLTGFVKLFKWAKGKGVATEAREGDQITLRNIDGQVNIFNNLTVNLYSSEASKSEAERLTRPLDHQGVESISLVGEDSESASVNQDERRYFVRGDVGNIRDDEGVFSLEIVTPNLDGKASGWRFYDGSAEYTVTVEDAEFLEGVKNRAFLLGAGDMIEAKMRTVQKRPNKRLITERTILEVLSFIPADSA